MILDRLRRATGIGYRPPCKEDDTARRDSAATDRLIKAANDLLSVANYFSRYNRELTKLGMMKR
jgi:hypothetical protein